MCASVVTSSAIPVLVADSNRMQSHLLTSALRRRPEFRIFSCLVNMDSILEAVASSPIAVLLLCLNPAVEIADQWAHR